MDPVTGHLAGVTYPDGGTYIFKYSPDGLMLTETDPENNIFEHDFDDMGRITDITDPEGGNWHYGVEEFTDGSLKITKTTREGNETVYTDHTESSGDYTSLIRGPSGGVTDFKKSSDGMTVTKTLPCGTALSFEYAYSEHKTRYVKKMREITPSGLERLTEQITKEYNDRNSDRINDQVIEEVSTDGKTVRYETDNLYDFKKVLTTPENRQLISYYNKNTGLTKQVHTDGSLYDTFYDYYGDGRLKDITVGSRTAHFAYDMVSDPKTVTVTDPKNKSTVYEYDSMMRLKTVRRPDSSTVSFDYDRNGNMTVLFPPSEFQHKFGYNGVNLNDSYKTPLENTYSYVYDRDRRLKEKRFPSGKIISYVYDPAKLERIETPEGNIAFTYNDCGTEVKTVSKGSENLEYGYDGSLLVSETLSGTLNQSLVYVYNNADGDRDFNIDALTYAGGTESYARDDDGLLTDAGRFHITRNIDNGLPGSVTGGDLSLTRSFNAYGENDGETFAVGGQNRFSWHIDERHNDGAVKQKTEDSSVYVYTYDGMGRLLTVTKDGVLSEEYRYDDFGRRDYEMNLPRGIAGRSLTYDEEDRLLTVAGNAIYDYDADGFLKKKTDGPDVTEYVYSSRGELLSVTLPDGRLIEYVHDPLGRRIAKKVNGTVVEKYLWEGLTRLLAVYDSNDSLLMRFEYADARMPVAMTKGGATYYLAYDQVGTLKAVANAAEGAVKRIEYDTFGNIIRDTNSDFAMPFGFAGGLYDKDTGLVRFGYRDYDPETGRWTAKDPIFFAGGDTDLYGYCLNDPINSVDPGGLFNFWGGIVGGVVGGVGAVIVGGALADDDISPSELGDAFMGGFAGGFIGGMFDVAAGGGAAVGAAVAAGLATATGQNTGAIIGAGIGGGIGGALAGYVGGLRGVALGTWVGTSRGWVFGLLGGKLYEHFSEKPSAAPCN